MLASDLDLMELTLWSRSSSLPKFAIDTDPIFCAKLSWRDNFGSVTGAITARVAWCVVGDVMVGKVKVRPVWAYNLLRFSRCDFSVSRICSLVFRRITNSIKFDLVFNPLLSMAWNTLALSGSVNSFGKSFWARFQLDGTSDTKLCLERARVNTDLTRSCSVTRIQR